MVLRGQLRGRVGRRREVNKGKARFGEPFRF